MKKNKSGLYKITNKVNGKVYYGSAVNIAKRWRDHRSALRRGVHKNPHLQSSWNKYGEHAFEFSVFAYCGKENLTDNEQILLDLYAGDKNCYNIALDATRPWLGRKHTEESKAKMAEARKGENNPNWGKPKSEETKRKLSEAMKGENNPMYGMSGEKSPMWGKTHSEETKQKMSLAKKGKKQSVVCCPHCNKTGGITNMKRYHFDNCKLRQEQ